MRATASTWLGALALLVGCSAIVRELEVTCENDCKALNDHEGLGDDACYIYQCRADGRGCEKRARDQDDDGVPDQRTCGDAGVEYDGALDCDDTSDARQPDARELCDGVDNDCDDRIDEGAYSRTVQLTRLDPGVSRVDSLGVAKSNQSLLLALTSRTMSTSNLQRTVLHTWPEQAQYKLQDDKFEERNCQGGLAHCAPREVVVAGTPSLLLALGIESVGAMPGRVRAAARRDWSKATKQLSWDAAETGSSNLADGIDAQSACEGAAFQASDLSLVMGQPFASGEMRGLALWRARAGGASSPLRGIDLSLASISSSASVSAAEGSCSSSWRRDDPDQRGVDPASLAVWSWRGSTGFLVGYDSARGAELAYVSGTERAASRAFAAATSTYVAAAGARHVAISIATGAEADQGVPIGMAFRARRGSVDVLRLAVLRFDGERDLQLEWEGDPLETGSGEVLEGPLLAYVSEGLRESEDASQRGGWLMAWIEAAAGSRRLQAAWIPFAAPEEMDGPFTLAEEATLKHAFAQAATAGEITIGYVADRGSGEQLNIGALKCDAPP